MTSPFGYVRERGRPFLASIGLLLMLVSFVWLQSLSQPSITPNDSEAVVSEEPFTVVVIDPGHGGQDSGTAKAGIFEKDLTLDVALRVERLLQRQGVATLLTRRGDIHVSLADRVRMANEQRNGVFVSIHFDDAARPAATGVETYYAAHQVSNPVRATFWLPFRRTPPDSANLESQSLASFIQEALASHTQAVNRGTAPQQFFVLANVRHPAALVEGGFLTNADEISKLATDDYREKIAAAIRDGVMNYREVMRQQQRVPLAAGSPGGE